MGSLTSRPKTPTTSTQVVYVPAPATTPSSAPAVSTPPADSGTTSPPATADEARTAGLLLRNRGLFGTVQTGFRGLLQLADVIPPRKTLLGE